MIWFFYDNIFHYFCLKDNNYQSLNTIFCTLGTLFCSFSLSLLRCTLVCKAPDSITGIILMELSNSELVVNEENQTYSVRWGSNLGCVLISWGMCSVFAKRWAEILRREQTEFPLTPMGVLAHRLRTLDGGAGSIFFYYPNFYYFFWGPMQKFETIRQSLLWFWITVVTRTPTPRKD